MQEFEKAAGHEFVHLKHRWLKAPTFLITVGYFVVLMNIVICWTTIVAK